MPKDEFKRDDHYCCHYCNIMVPAKCSDRDKMTVIMIEKCPGFIPAGGLSAEYFNSKYKLEAEDAKQ